LFASQSLSATDRRAALVGIGGEEVEGAADEIRGGMAAGDWKKELRSVAGVEVDIEEGGAAMVTCSFLDNRLYRDIGHAVGSRVVVGF